MTVNFKLRNLFALALFISFSSFAETNNNLAPVASSDEAQLSFRDLPNLKEAFIDTTPTKRNDGLAIGTLGINGGKADMIVKFAKEIASGKHGKYDSMLISHKDKLLFESYYLRGRVNLPHYQASATKVYTSLAVGRAIQLGYLTMADLDKPLVSFLKDLDSTKFVEGAENITLHKAMTMRSGIRISRDTRKELTSNPSQLKGQGQIQAWLAHSAPITSESQSYLYSFDPSLVMPVLEAVVPGSVKDFIKTELLDKMGITTYDWQTGLNGLPSAGSGANMTSRAMIKFGSLVLNKGKWKGKQLISVDYLAKATSAITNAAADWQPESFNYGYYFYQTNITIGDKNYDANVIWGGGGQHIVTVAALDLVIVITGHDQKDEIFKQIVKSVLPAFVKKEST